MLLFRQAVVLNLRFDTDATRRLGIEGLVCELQLTTLDFGMRGQVCSSMLGLILGGSSLKTQK